jgi:hypothetical protein
MVQAGLTGTTAAVAIAAASASFLQIRIASGLPLVVSINSLR